MSGSGASASRPQRPARSLYRTAADLLAGDGVGSPCPFPVIAGSRLEWCGEGGAAIQPEGRSCFLFDDLVGASQQYLRELDAEAACGMLVQKQLELSSLEDWDLARFLAIQDLMNLASEMARRIAKLGGVGHQPTGFDIF